MVNMATALVLTQGSKRDLIPPFKFLGYIKYSKPTHPTHVRQYLHNVLLQCSFSFLKITKIHNIFYFDILTNSSSTHVFIMFKLNSTVNQLAFRITY